MLEKFIGHLSAVSWDVVRRVRRARLGREIRNQQRAVSADRGKHLALHAGEAHSRYRAHPYAGRVIAFDSDRHETQVWHLAQADLALHRLDCTHETIMSPPHLARVGYELAKELEKLSCSGD